jgi:polysaccharide transporter, PST family
MISGPQSKKSRLLSNIASLCVLQGLNYLVALVVLPYLVRVVGIGTYGLAAFSQSFAQYFVLFTDYGFNLSATHSIAQNIGNIRAIKKTFLEVFPVAPLGGWLCVPEDA